MWHWMAGLSLISCRGMWSRLVISHHHWQACSRGRGEVISPWRSCPSSTLEVCLNISQCFRRTNLEVHFWFWRWLCCCVSIDSWCNTNSFVKSSVKTGSLKPISGNLVPAKMPVIALGLHSQHCWQKGLIKQNCCFKLFYSLGLLNMVAMSLF